jgi:hypothetical protein
MTRKNDILTPEGYFENLQDRLSQIPARQQPVSTVRRIAPYFAYAASLLVAVMLGNAVLKKTAAPAQDDNWTYVSYLADALDPDGAALYEEDEWYEDGGQDLSEDDIINYLIADGISVEHLNYVNYEEGY